MTKLFIPGSLLNASIHPELLRENPNLATLIPANADISLDSCDLYNLTFSSSADQNVFEMGHGSLKCRSVPKARREGNGETAHVPLRAFSGRLSVKEVCLIDGAVLFVLSHPFFFSPSESRV